MNELDETLYIVDCDDEVIDAFDNYESYKKKCDDYKEAMWLCQKVAEWFSEHDQANENFARFAEIDDRFVVSKFS